jgi:hypothetical protein
VEQLPRAQRPEYAIAFRSIRAAKNLAATLIILCILVQIGATLAVHFARVFDELPAAAAAREPRTLPAADSDTEPATQPATQPADSDVSFAAICSVVLKYGLPGTRFAAMILCLLLVLMVMFAVKLSLVERIGGVAGFISAFNWSLILLMMLLPWKQILSSTLSCGALFNLSELTRADSVLGETPVLLDQVLFYARFIAYPCVALFTCLIVQTKFARGYSNADFKLDETNQPPMESPTPQMLQ